MPRGLSTATPASKGVEGEGETFVGNGGEESGSGGMMWAPGTPAPGREQTVGEAWAAMQYHGRGTRKVDCCSRTVVTFLSVC